MQTLRISIILNVHNEGDEVQKTIENIKATVKQAVLEFIVVDDASTDGSCEHLGSDIKVIRNNERIGVTRSRNKGARIATWDIIVNTDGHVRLDTFNEGTTLESAARLAVEKQAIVTPAVGNFTDSEGSGCQNAKWYYSTIEQDDYGCLKIKRLASKMNDEPYQRVIGPSDGFYVIPRNVFFTKLGMFSPYTGRHGWAEIGAAVRAWFADVPILSVPNFVVAHKFKSTLSYDVSATNDIFANKCLTHFTCFDDSTYKSIWEPMLRECGDYEEVKKWIFSNEVLNDHKRFLSTYKKRGDDEFFTEVLGSDFKKIVHR